MVAVTNFKIQKIEPFTFTFNSIDNPSSFPSITKNKNNQILLQKWGMDQTFYMQKVSYEQYLYEHEMEQFLIQLFNTQQLQALSSSGSFCKIRNVRGVKFRRVATSVTSMSFFDRITDPENVRSNGAIVDCFDEYTEDFILSSELQKLIALDSYEKRDLYNDQERDEFIFRLLGHFCLGGGLCQREVEIEPYLDCTRDVYKDLVAVCRDSNTKELKISSIVLKIDSIDTDQVPLFPNDNPQNFMFFVFDYTLRTVSVVYNGYLGGYR